MARTVARLEVLRMTDRALWNFVLGNLPDCGPRSMLAYEHQKKLFDQINEALLELHKRGVQLQLPLTG